MTEQELIYAIFIKLLDSKTFQKDCIELNSDRLAGKYAYLKAVRIAEGVRDARHNPNQE